VQQDEKELSDAENDVGALERLGMARAQTENAPIPRTINSRRVVRSGGT